MASSPSSADSGYVTGGTESRGGHLHRDIDGLSSDSTKDIASWIRPTIHKLCNKLSAPAAVPHILAGVTTILTQPSHPSNNDRANQKEEKKDKIQALIAAVYLYVRTRLSQCDTGGAEYVSQRKEILSTLAHLREDEKVEWEGWEKVIPNDVDAWLMEINKRGWLKLGWFGDVLEGAGLEVKDGNGQPERLAEEQERVEEEHSLAEKQRLAQKQERLRLGQVKKRLAKERRLAEEKERLRLAKKQKLTEEQDRLAEEQKLAEQQERLRLEEEQRIAEEQKRLRVAEERRLAEERGRAEKQRLKLVEEQEKLAEEQKLAKEQERLRLAKKQKLTEEQDRLAEEQKLADEQERQRVAKEEKLAQERRLAEERERKIFAEEQSLADEEESPAEEQSPVEEQEMPSQEQEQEMPVEEQRLVEEQQSPVEEHRLAEELNSCLKRKRDANAAESPSRYQKKRKIDNAEDIEDDIHEQELYRIENPGEEVLRVIPIAGGKSWNLLPRKESATVDNWTFNIGDTVYVRIAGKPDGLVKVSEIIQLEPEYEAVVLAWYYPRDGIEGELRGPRKMPKGRQAHLDRHWPPYAPFTWMLSSNRTINMANTLRRKASTKVMAKVCPDKFYVTDDNPNKPIRKMCNAGDRKYKWMTDLLQLKPKKGVDARSDNCLIPGADAMSDIQPSATPEPQNPTLCMSPPMIPPLPPSEETLANADGESPTVSTMLNQTTIESSSAASIVTEAAQYDMKLSELSENVLYLDDIGFFELPWTPYNVSKETGGELSTVSTFDPATIDSNRITSPTVAVAPHDIEMSEGVHLEESGIVADKPMEFLFEPWASDLNWNNSCGSDILNPEYTDLMF